MDAEVLQAASGDCTWQWLVKMEAHHSKTKLCFHIQWQIQDSHNKNVDFCIENNLHGRNKLDLSRHSILQEKLWSFKWLGVKIKHKPPPKQYKQNAFITQAFFSVNCSPHHYPDCYTPANLHVNVSTQDEREEKLVPLKERSAHVTVQIVGEVILQVAQPSLQDLRLITARQ